ncbi:MAG: hypothetical protein B7C54_03710 [Acidimicrobiales bacterium mtb01]|nr:hypothetical protein [Actinomycetota bacterium]TEX47397.1 MAG: hypothetical protein B7C54_03710 [Acidimicrobiales bacterium mtb01]
MAEGSVFRVTVRGRFVDLSPEARASLAREVDHHDIFKSAFTPEGTFTYDDKILFFNLRYEVRTSNGEDAAREAGQREAELFLRTLGYGHSDLKVTASNVSDVWRDHPSTG